jgi:ABC-type transporter Mla maintaining outer membrane lipid asymmetry ATPase subunit MlaF
MALIEIRGLYKNFGRSEILRDINLDIEESRVLAIIGPRKDHFVASHRPSGPTD